MDQDQCRKKLDESRKKLSAICKQLDLVSGTGPEKREWRCIHEIVSSVEELQSLIAWIIEKRGTKEESSVITQKLQKLNRIRKVLEKSASESQKYLWPLLNQEHRTVSDLELQKSFKCCENSDISSRRKVVNFDLPCESASTTPTKSDNTFDFTDCSSEETLYDHSEDPDQNFDLVEDKNKKVYIGENFAPFHSLAKPCMVHETEYQHDSLCTAVSEDEGLGEESRRGDSTGPNSLLEIPDPMSDLPFDLSLPPEAFCDETPPCLPNVSSWTLDSSNHRNSLELCLTTIAKLKTALSGKEDELLKLKSDRIAEDEVLRLKSVVENLKNDVENLQLKVKTLEKENESLKEQVLELEEAENDARFKGQHLQEKLIFLQEKDNHFQTELSEAKRSLELCIEELSLKDNEERELQSQLKYMEVLVQKYEDQIRRMELSESDLKHSLKRMDEKHREIIRNLEIKKTKGEEKGTQTYTDPNALHQSSESSQESVQESVHFSSNEYPFITTDEDEFILIPPAFRSVYCDKTNVAVQTDELSRNSTPVNKFPQLVCVGCETDHSGGHEGSVENCSPVPILTCPVQKELLKRLHNLAEEDADLQQQLHHVDQINLSLWQKLHDLQFHIGECQKENLSEDESSRVDNASDNRSSTERSTQLTPSNEVLSNYSALFCSEFNDEKLKDRLTNLETINASFLKQLELREQLCAETEKKHSEWIQAEHQFLEELKSLKIEKDSLLSQISQLEAEKNQLRIDLGALETELNFLREKNERELSEILSERDSMLSEKQTKIDSLRAKEKDHMKQISKLQCEKRKGEERSEFETLKNSYVQLQIELEQCRDEMGSMKQEFERQLRFLRDKHRSDENRMVQALESLREKDSDCNKKLSEVQVSQAEMENTLTLKEKELENARSEFKLAMQATEEQHKLVEDELRKKLYQMEEGTAVATKALTEEKRRLEKELQGNIDDLRSKEAVYKSRIQELETNVAQLHTELHRLTGNLRVKCDGEETSTGIASFQRERLLKELQELRVREGELREKLDEMEKKEAAYRETLEHADRIVASVERGYKNKIEELELSEKSLKQKVGYLEEVENGLRIALQRERRSSDGRKPEELVVELTEAEKRENTLKEELSKLEQSHRNLSQKVKDLEKIRENLESQLSDREDLALSLEKVKKEQETTKKELLKLKKSEGSFQLALEHTESLLKTREADMEAEVQRFTDEKKGLEETIHQLRSQVRDLEQQLEKHRAEELESENDVCGYSEAEVLNGSPLATLNQEYSSDQTTADDNEIQVEQNAVWPQLECEPLNYRTLPSNDARSLFFNCDPNRKPETACGKNGAAILSDEETGRQNNCLDNCDTRHPDDAGNYGVHSLSNHNVMGHNSNVFPGRSEPIRAIENIPMNEAEGVRSSSVPSSDLEPTRMDSEYHKVRLHLEQCMLRAMDAMKMEMENKANSASPERYTPEANECVMHPPLNFHVVQQVGSDTVLVGWEYSPISTLVGFEVYVNGQLHETVLTPDRRKAVISDLNLSQPLTLSIYAISSTGQVSEPQTIQLDTNSKQGSGFFFQEDDDDDDDFFDDVSSREIRPYSMEW